MKGGVNKTEGTLLLAAAHFLLKIDGVPAGRRVEEPPRCSELHLPEPLIRSPASAAQGSPPPPPRFPHTSGFGGPTAPCQLSRIRAE